MSRTRDQHSGFTLAQNIISSSLCVTERVNISPLLRSLSRGSLPSLCFSSGEVIAFSCCDSGGCRPVYIAPSVCRRRHGGLTEASLVQQVTPAVIQQRQHRGEQQQKDLCAATPVTSVSIHTVHVFIPNISIVLMSSLKRLLQFLLRGTQLTREHRLC